MMTKYSLSHTNHSCIHFCSCERNQSSIAIHPS